MDTISSEIVEKTYNKLGRMPPQEAPKMVDRMSKQQPLVLAYLMATGHDVLNQEERELLLYLGVVVWQIMNQGTKSLPEITEEILDETEDSNMKMLEYLDGETETGFIDTLEKIINNYNQPEVLRYVVEALVEEPKEESVIRDENIGIMMIFLKTVIDSFDK
jgi:hypothetical protein